MADKLLRLRRVEPGLYRDDRHDAEIYAVSPREWQATIHRSWVTTQPTKRAAVADLERALQ